ncbi:MAG: TetR/AcrR family transcriptional regulator [Bacteroidia bacterium]|nr:TetR/AcrR family transcriptional regulator [Bacteroidia bacterium]
MRDTIIETAQRLFLQQGLRTTTMDQIAESLGISKKTLYEYFDSKDTLIAACADSFLTRMERELETLRSQHSENVLLSMTATASYAYQVLASINPILFKELRRLLPPARAQVIPRIQKLITHHLSRSLEEGIRQGIFRPDLPVDLLPLWVSYAILHIVLNSDFAQQVNRPVAEIYAETLLLLLHSFCSEKGRNLLETYRHSIRKAYAK